MAKKQPAKLPVGTFESILGASETAGAESLPVPEWGCTVRLRGMTRGETIRWYDLEDGVASEAHVLSHGVAEPALTLEQATELIEKKGHAPVRRVVGEIMKLSGLGASFREEPTG